MAMNKLEQPFKMLWVVFLSVEGESRAVLGVLVGLDQDTAQQQDVVPISRASLTLCVFCT